MVLVSGLWVGNMRECPQPRRHPYPSLSSRSILRPRPEEGEECAREPAQLDEPDDSTTSRTLTSAIPCQRRISWGRIHDLRRVVRCSGLIGQRKRHELVPSSQGSGHVLQSAADTGTERDCKTVKSFWLSTLWPMTTALIFLRLLRMTG